MDLSALGTALLWSLEKPVLWLLRKVAGFLACHLVMAVEREQQKRMYPPRVCSAIPLQVDMTWRDGTC